MKVNELRVGNLISDDDGCIAKVNGFTPYDHSVRCDEEEGCVLLIDVYHELTDKWKMGREADSPECKPIPLTPEWLERLDYKKDLLDGKYYKQGSVLPPLYWINECRWGMSALPVTGHHFQYVHQLQNLYFALTGEELKVKL